MSTLETLIAARALIEDESRWIKGSLRAFKSGRECYCAAGAVFFAVNTGNASKALDSLEAHVLPMRGGNMHIGRVERFNDLKATSHGDVLALFDRAIEAERAKAGAR